MATDGPGPPAPAPDDAPAPVVPEGTTGQPTGRHRAVEGAAAAGPEAPSAERPAGTEAVGATGRPIRGTPVPGRPGGAAPVPRARGRHAAPRSRLRTALILILGIVVVAVGIGVGALTITTRHYEANVSRIQNAFPTTGRPSTGPAAAGAVTFLVVAVERGPRAPARLVTDSVMLLRLTADDKHAEVVFLPVDLWLSPAGRPAATVGAMFRSGGSAGLIAGVEGASGVRIDHYAQLDLDGFRTVTDAVGGVDVTIPRPYQAKGRAFTAGPQHLDGAAALAYVRATTVADHAQDAAREQLVMSALFARLGTIGALSDLGTMTRVVGAVSSALRVDSSLDDPGLVRLAWDHRGVGSPDFLSAPVSGRGVRGGQTVSLPDAARLSQLWAALRADDLAGHVGAFR